MRLILLLSALLLSAGSIDSGPAATVAEASVYLPAVPVVVDREYNILAEISLQTSQSGHSLDWVDVEFSGLDAACVRNIKLVSTGTMQVTRSASWALNEERKRIGGGASLWCDPSWCSDVASAAYSGPGVLRLCPALPLRDGDNRMYVSISVDSRGIADLSAPFTVSVKGLSVDGKDVPFAEQGSPVKRLGVSVRQHGDDGVYAYRIPGLVTTPSGTLISVYDVRYPSSLDLQNDIDIGVSRSTDGGRTWEPMRIVMDMGCYGGLPQAQNGVGDPSVLVDNGSGRIFVVAAWTHGLGANRAWTSVGQGFSPEQTAQLMIVSSDDDGITWSAPVNITRQVKQEEWYFTLQGPGRGICMKNGTLVFPVQHIGTDRIPRAGIMYSRDGGKTWATHSPAAYNTTESAVAELPDGTLMLSMRNNRKTGRIVATTRDYGRSWNLHGSTGRLVEPVCMASLISVPAAENCIGKNLMLFSNPAVPQGRHHMTVKSSLDDGNTWSEGLLIDEDDNWGYSCLTMIDRETVGILYESSAAQLLFQAIKLKDLVMAQAMNTASLPEVADREYAKGVSAPLCGTLDGCPVLAGGANFPDKPLLDGGAKKVYKDIWMMMPGKGWILAGALPDSVAYGASFQVGKRVIFAGGSVVGKPSAAVYRLEKSGSRVRVKAMPPLPEGVAEAGWASEGEHLFLVGGVSASGKSDVVYHCEKAGGKWSPLASLPVPLVQPVAFASGGKLYVWGGFDPTTLEVYSEGWCLDLKSGQWTSAPGVPDGGTFVGASALPLGSGRLLVMGGVNIDIFRKALHNGPEDRMPYLSMEPAEYKFRDTVWIFDADRQEWECAGKTCRAALAGAGIALWNGSVLVAGGEIKPGVRSPQIFKLEL